MNYSKILYILLVPFFIIFSVNATQAQNVGIGEASPAQKLHIDGSASGLQTIRIEDCAVTAAGSNPGEDAPTATTTKKAVYTDANGDLTVRYVYGDNVQSAVLSSGTQLVTSTTLVDIAGTSITFTPRHPIVYISFTVSGNSPLTNTQSAWLVVSIDKDGSTAASFLNLSAEQDDLEGSSSAATVTAANFPLAVTAGTSVTIKLRARVGGADATDGFTIDKANYTTYITIWD